MEGETREEWKQRMGIGQRTNMVSSGQQTNRTPVVGDEGRFRGQVVGYRTEHADGRVDATSTKQDLKLMPNVTIARRQEQ